MKLKDFEYELPKEFIAQNPPQVRGESSLLVLNKDTGNIEHKKYKDIPDFVKEGDVIVLNKTKVIRARLFAKVARNGRDVEVLFLNKLKETESRNYRDNSFINNVCKPDGLISEGLEAWSALIGRARHIEIGDVLDIKDEKLVVLDRKEGEAGFVVGGINVMSVIAKYGHVPLPPYIKRPDNASDRVRYNTIFATYEGSVAAPTASINLTDSILERIKNAGAIIVYVNLHVSWGTFAPVNTEEIEDFKIHAEYVEVPKETVDIINSAKGRIWAFGTTVVRSLESVAVENKKIKEFYGETDLYIYPPYKFKVVDVLITNFHAPGTSLIMLVAAFAGKEGVLNAYETAKANHYRFLSYGDSMLIL